MRIRQSLTIEGELNEFIEPHALKPQKLLDFKSQYIYIVSIMNKPFPYFGGKNLTANILVKMLPYHQVYVEVFGGGASLLFKKQPSFMEIYNDINYNLYNFFKVVRDCPEELQRIIDRTPVSRALFDIEDYDKCENEVERAALFWFRQKYSRISKGDYFDVGINKSSKRITIAEYWHRLRDVALENVSYEKLFELYDKDTTFFYLDPPYYPRTTAGNFCNYGKIYKVDDWDKKEGHEKLASDIKKLKGFWALSYNDNDEIRELYKEYKIKEIDLHLSANNINLDKENVTKRSKELIIWNY